MHRKIGLVLVLMALVPQLQAQDFQGEATYFSKTQIDIDFSGRDIPEDRKQQMMERIKQANERTYTLSFNRTASVYKEEERLETPGGPGGGPRFAMFGSGGGDYYKNVQQGNYAVSQDLFGKIFLVQDSLPKLQWKMDGATKKIGNYTAFKAVATKTVKRANMQAIFRRGNDNDENKGEEFTEKEIQIVAWYTPDIPINQGPGEYWGLPGLILEVSDDRTTILCTKITLNTKDGKEIKEPTKGKKVSQEEYDAIAKEKMEEMRENFRNRRGGGPGGGGRRQ